MTAATICCVPVAQLAEPGPGSIALNCYQCGTAVWLQPELSGELGDRGVASIDVRCPTCTPAGVPYKITASQIATLRADGLDPLDIARCLALCSITGGDTTAMATFVEQLEHDPHGPDADRYRMALVDAFVAVAEAAHR
jgi:hypothetical protein